MSVWLPRHALVGVGLATASAGRLGARPLLLIGATHMHQRHMQLRASAPIPLSRRLASTDATSSTHKPSSALASSEPKPAPLVTPSSASKEISDPKEPLGKRVWKKVKHEAQHYWHGSKLLVSEVRIASRLQLKILRGGNLTRRERRQVCRYASYILIIY
jgi:LETM1 and EF-hand domain-containing protein 1